MLEALMNTLATLPTGTVEMVGTWVAALLTLMVLSYIFGSNPAFRLAEYLFVGTAAGYAAAIVWNHTLWPRLLPFLQDPIAYWHYGVFFILGLLLLARGCGPLASLGNLPLGVLFGTGAGLALGGALAGSLVPQLAASIVSVSPADYGAGLAGWAQAVDALLVILGTTAVLSAFHYSAKGRGLLGSLGHGFLRIWGKLGRKLIMVAFGVLLAGAALSFFTLLVSRLDFLVNDWLSSIVGMGL